jgi:hypothetical protein
MLRINLPQKEAFKEDLPKITIHLSMKKKYKMLVVTVLNLDLLSETVLKAL